MTNRHLTPLEVAEQLQCSRDHLYKAVARGELRALRLGRAYRFSEDEIAAYVKRNTA